MDVSWDIPWQVGGEGSGERADDWWRRRRLRTWERGKSVGAVDVEGGGRAVRCAHMLPKADVIT